MSDTSEISKLLKLKSQELPPPDYFEDFLREFQKRQRAELLRRSVWEIFWDRMGSIAPNFRVPQYAYATVLFAAAGVSGMMFLKMPQQGGSLAANENAPSVFSSLTAKPVTITDTIPVRATLPAHYVLQTRPVSYEQPVSF